ncbi:Predicted metal-dependent hydrolase, TIM-barrel fold [Kushneria avicenniae]|uniref:Predicted metal-dependent hydrolase, TIM-barrel fold n=1 Tax=Kushneria avicenniae TaxID=402385 RepID=A0A1I1MNJ8_9GAMM|nr:amidohydrolase family protein [Kushneria avicenniae]SFC86969.1 Predicted metal-dependent hydrolase, TIM-barrel fold [Kushneria avicenniae]
MTDQHDGSITGVDTHAHIFSQHLPMARQRRYSPDYDADVSQYLAHLDRCGLSHGVLVQPSFLGTDNSYMLSALRQHGERLRGTAVVAPDIDDPALDVLGEAGVVGVRLNLVGQTLDDYGAAHWRHLFTRLAHRGWSVEIQRTLGDLGPVVPAILESGVAVVIDHYGLPQGGAIDTSLGEHRTFLDWLGEGNLWIKLSATYRSGMSVDQARAAIDTFQEAFGHAERLVWGSDWPHTRFEDQTDHEAQFVLMETLLPDPALRRQVMIDNPARLFMINAQGAFRC